MSVLLHFEEYQKARVKFVQAIAEAATRPQNIEVMNSNNLPMVSPLHPSCQETSAASMESSIANGS